MLKQCYWQQGDSVRSNFYNLSALKNLVSLLLTAIICFMFILGIILLWSIGIAFLLFKFLWNVLFILERSFYIMCNIQTPAYQNSEVTCRYLVTQKFNKYAIAASHGVASAAPAPALSSKTLKRSSKSAMTKILYQRTLKFTTGNLIIAVVQRAYKSQF
jgi:hypothetical protein